MAAKDIYHQHVRRALEKDGWTITHDPLSVQWLGKVLQFDLGAERIIAAERGEEKIAIEVKSFLSPSPIEDLRDAIGQFIIYREALFNANSPRQLFWRCEKTFTQTFLKRMKVNSCVFASESKSLSFTLRTRRSSNGSTKSLPRYD